MLKDEMKLLPMELRELSVLIIFFAKCCFATHTQLFFTLGLLIEQLIMNT